MHIERLTLMQQMLMEVHNGTWKQPEETPFGATVGSVRFDLGYWVTPLPNRDGVTCGYAACAVGHAILDDRFEGLSISHGSPVLVGGRTGWPAVAAYFGIDWAQATYLFDPDCYEVSISEDGKLSSIPAIAVAQRVQLFISSNGEINEH